MTTAQANPLVESGKPLFLKAADAAGASLAPPPLRRDPGRTHLPMRTRAGCGWRPVRSTRAGWEERRIGRTTPVRRHRVRSRPTAVQHPGLAQELERLARHLRDAQREWNAADERVQSCLVEVSTLEGDIRNARDKSKIPALKEKLEAGGCSIPYPQRDVHIVERIDASGS
mgnify:CR=1 FL=1